MSMILTAQAMKLKIGNPARKLVLLKLADNANDDGVCFPSYKNIAEHCEMSRQSAINHIDALIELGLVSKKERKTENGNTSNLYILHLEGGQKVSLGVVKNFDHPSQNPELGVVKNFDPEPININQSINHTNLTSCINTHASEPEKKSALPKKTAKALLAEFGITDQLADDFIALRKAKKAPITETTLNRLQKQADIAKLPLAEVVAIMLERGWTGFQADWNWGGGQTKPQNGTQSEKRGNVNVQADWSGLIL